ncbi:4-hydroxyphenylpyruvate dioxygenase-like protein [Lepeophtheirus salmonis]|uniref:VOC domain-containing protein n=1 Tax=Lepeophtheirus salmonis TaxID=72036 RepID=A0A0K2UVD1_LEPSM|nr:4-hydroxyphenylpyruvate dioxygenase-like protein [Lepeophtheirus salmonis]
MWCINHLEWCVTDIECTERLLESHFGYRVIAERVNELVVQRLLALGDTRLLLTQRRAGPSEKQRRQDTIKGYPTLFCCRYSHCRDSVFNVVLSVSDFEAVVQRLRSSDRILVDSSQDVFKYVIIKAPCENVIHVIMEQRFRDSLPGFHPIKKERMESIHSVDNEAVVDPYIDHVTYVVPKGESLKVIDWYTKYLGMKRFFVQPNELESKGVEINDHVGLRLMVGEWLTSWSCREVGVRDPNTKSSSVMLVLAEPLEENSNSHVQKFLNNNDGPGIQHVGLAVRSKISNVVSKMIKNGCNFQKPPPTYYQLPSKIIEIKQSGEDLDTFSKLGLLIDSEADIEKETSQNSNEKNFDKFLIQIFTKPLFKEDTFFIEVLQRKGARGFGSGNIAALAESIILYNKEIEETQIS